MSISPQTNGQLSRRGFTLMELLVTVGIIALLASLLVPAISKMRRNAEMTQCASNLRQVYHYFYQDVQDYNMQIPPASNSQKDSSGQIPSFAGVDGGGYWLNKTWDSFNSTGQAKTASVFGCPTQRKTHKLAANARTYSMNSIVASTYWNGGLNNSVPGAISYNRFAQPAKTVIFADGYWDGSSYNSAINGSDKMPEGIHDGFSDLMFLDGHTERMKRSDIPTIASSDINRASTLGSPASVMWFGR